MKTALMVCFLSLASLPWLAGAAWPHEWYPIRCCSLRDCAPIDQTSVQITPEGYLVTLEAGDHPFVTEHSVTLWRFEDADQTNNYPVGQGAREAQRSQDSDYHICIVPGGRALCFFAPDTGT